MKVKKKITIPVILIIAVLGAIVLTVYGGVQKHALTNRYPDMAWEEKAQLYEKYLLREGILPEYYVNLKILADLPLKAHLTLQNKNEAPVIRVLFSYDYRRSHYLVYADADWRRDKITISPLHSEISDDPGQALVLCSRDWARDGEEVYYGEVFSPGFVSIKAYILAENDPQPVYISMDYDLRTGGFMVEAPLSKIWLRDKDGGLSQIK